MVLSLQKRFFRKDKAFIVKNQEILNIYFFCCNSCIMLYSRCHNAVVYGSRFFLVEVNSSCVLSRLFVFKSLIRAFIIKSCRNLVFLYSLCPILEVSTSFFFVATKLMMMAKVTILFCNICNKRTKHAK